MTHAELRRTGLPRRWMIALALPLLIGADAGLAADASRSTTEVAMTNDAIRTSIESLSERDAKQFYLHCSRAALSGRLGSGEAAACSVGYELLLQRHFGGDFEALLAWSRSQPHDGGVPAIIGN